MQASEPGSPEFSRTASQSTMATTVDGKDVASRLELVRSHSEMPYSWVDLDGARRYEPYVTTGRERKESSASSIGSTSAVRENKQRMNAFWDADPVDIAVTLTKMEWEYFIALTVPSLKNLGDGFSLVIFRDICGLRRINATRILLWSESCIILITSRNGLL